MDMFSNHSCTFLLLGRYMPIIHVVYKVKYLLHTLMNAALMVKNDYPELAETSIFVSYLTSVEIPEFEHLNLNH